MPHTAPPHRIAGYPTQTEQLRFGAHDIDVLTVAQLERYVDTAALLRDSDAPEPPYWAYIWPSSRTLAHLIATELDCHNTRVIDIGCGLGLVSLVAARCGAEVTALDLAENGIAFTRANAQWNNCPITTLHRDIRTPGCTGPFDFCFAADVTYDPVLQTAIPEFLANYLSPTGQAWCAESVRTNDTTFQKTCTTLGLRVQESLRYELDEGKRIPIRLTCVSRR